MKANKKNLSTIKDSIADCAAGPADESLFVPRKDPNFYPTEKKADVDDDRYRLEPLELKEQRALEYLDYYNQKLDKNMAKTFGLPQEVMKQARSGLRPTWIALRKAA